MSSRTPYRLAVIDLDETLLGPDKQISPENLQALDRLRQAGIEVAIASGRHHLNIVRLAERYDIHGWIVSSQGAMVKHSQSGQILYERTLPTDLALEILAIGRTENLSVLAYDRCGVFVEEETEWIRLYISRAGHAPRRADLKGLATQGLEKILLSESSKRIESLAPVLIERYRNRLYVVVTEHEIVEFCSAEANKALGAQAIAQKLGLRAEEVVAFGDGNNDIPMLEWAGGSVAMNHGRQGAKEAAKWVTSLGPAESAFARGVGLLFSN